MVHFGLSLATHSDAMKGFQESLEGITPSSFTATFDNNDAAVTTRTEFQSLRFWFPDLHIFPALVPGMHVKLRAGGRACQGREPDVVILGDLFSSAGIYNCVEKLRASNGIHKFIVTHFRPKLLFLIGQPDVVLLPVPFDLDTMLTEIHCPGRKLEPRSPLPQRQKPPRSKGR